MQHLEVAAPAKINLILSVGDRRSDGYHNIWSLMQQLDLHDSLRFSCDVLETEDANLLPLSITLQCSDNRLPCQEDNLVYRAAKAVMERAGIRATLSIHLTKRIPVAAGLGGGSSDAAATIHALNHMFDLGWGSAECAQLGADLGSDVPFFFYGPTSIVRGTGGEVSPVILTTPQWVVLVKPPVDISTAWAYQQLVEMRTSQNELMCFNKEEVVETFLQSPRSTAEIYPYCWNTFEEIMEKQFPDLALIQQEHYNLGADVSMLSGSGSTVFGIYPSEQLAMEAERTFQGRERYQAWKTETKVSKRPTQAEMA